MLPYSVAVTFVTWHFEHLAAALNAPAPQVPDTENSEFIERASRLDTGDLKLTKERIDDGLAARAVEAPNPRIVLAIAELLSRHRDLLVGKPEPALKRLFADRTA